jgi:hypothetical protein
MNDTKTDDELIAIQTLLSTLGPLDGEARNRVIEYVFQRLNLALKSNSVYSASLTETSLNNPTSPLPTNDTSRLTKTDIRTFSSQKMPKNDVERTTLVAFYLSEVAIDSEKKTEIGTDDILKYFKQANFPVPVRPRQVLVNTKNSGYIDASTNRGFYKINPVGYNFIAYSLPAGSNSATTKKKKRNKKSQTKTKKK